MQIFDGASLKNWEGSPTFWHVEDGAIVGERPKPTPSSRTPSSSIVAASRPISSCRPSCGQRLDSGIQYRSVQVPADDEKGKWVLKGYQADIDFNNGYTGMLYRRARSRDRRPRGQVGLLAEPQRGVIGSTGTADELKQIIKVMTGISPTSSPWLHAVDHILNGRVTGPSGSRRGQTGP